MNTTLLVPGLMAFLHHLLAFAVVVTLAIELVVFSARPTVREARLIQRADLFYGISAGLVVLIGLMRAGMFEKGWTFYTHNGFFWIKMGLLVAAGLLSIYPTVRFLKWSPLLKQGEAPVIAEAEALLIRRILWLEAGLLVAVLLAAPLMTRALWIWG
ncbi:MAG: DUF2214 family protein [Bacteroidia bacterium]|nr:DUF2214 family protein [Bacteroidia bacterium]